VGGACKKKDFDPSSTWYHPDANDAMKAFHERSKEMFWKDLMLCIREREQEEG
jgi:hypothetical protein